MKYTGFKVIFYLMFIIIVSLGVKAEEEPLVNSMFYETDLREAISELSIQTGVNIIPDMTVGGVVTADIKNVPLEKALNMILVSGGYTFRKIDDYYLVGLADPKNITFSELSEFEIVQLKNITVEEVYSLLPSFLSNYVKGDRGTNLLSINAAPKEVKRIKEFIKQIDLPRRQIEIRLLVTEVDTKMAKELGINFEYYSTGDVNNSIAYSGKENLIKIEADLYGRLLSRLKVMEEEQQATIEADPYILVNDGGTANLFIGEEQVLLIQNEGSYSSTTRTEEVKVGIGMEVTAKIMGGDQVYLELAPVISHFIDEVRPDILVKENSMSTSLQIKSGQTVCLAGMTLKSDSEYTRKVPLLGNIPLVRWLFSNENKEEKERELFVFVTPVIK